MDSGATTLTLKHEVVKTQFECKGATTICQGGVAGGAVVPVAVPVVVRPTFFINIFWIEAVGAETAAPPMEEAEVEAVVAEPSLIGDGVIVVVG